MADGLGYLVGSLVVFCGLTPIRHTATVLLLGVGQTAAVYGIALCSYGKTEGRRARLARILLREG
jgi:hypothetical protein